MSKFSNIPILNKIDSDKIYELLFKGLSKGAKILLIIIVMYIIIKIGNKIIDKFTERQSEMRFSLNDRKAKTLGAILKSVLKYTVYILGVLSIITLVVGPVSWTFAGIGGVAIGFGTQSLVKDLVNGFFILFEDQFAVGEFVDIDGKSGIVESLELRLTKIRDFNGDLHIIPNGMITKVTNHSRGDMRFLVEVEVAYEENIDKVIKILQDACDKFKKENSNIVDGPKVLGVSQLKESGITIKILGKSKSMTQGETEMQLRKIVKEELDRANIEIPYPKLKIVKE